MKTFNHLDNSKLLGKLDKREIDGRRFYTTPSGKELVSVTTFLSYFPKPQLERWKKRIGTNKANKITYQSAEKGKSYHSLVESYLKNSYNTDDVMPHIIEHFNNMKPILDRIDNIHCIEAMIYSEIMGLAGQVDLIAEFDGVTSIIDNKTSLRPKREEWIENYFLQETCYSLLYEDMTGIKVKQLVTLISVDNDSPQVFIKERKEYIPLLVEKLKEFRKGKKE